VSVVLGLEPGASEGGGSGGGGGGEGEGSLGEAALAAGFCCCEGGLWYGWLDDRHEDFFCHLGWEFVDVAVVEEDGCGDGGVGVLGGCV
jgi:hypothetical protein